MRPFFTMTNSCDGNCESVEVRFTKACDNRCSFCVERHGLSNLEMADPKVLAATTIQTGLQEVLILGGEPMLYPSRVAEYIRLIRSHVKKIYLTTSLPNTFNDPRYVLDINSILMNLDGLNVSVQSADWEENNKILNATSPHNRIEILRNLNADPFTAEKIRTNLNLVKGGIDTKEKLISAIAVLERVGCKFLKLNELQHEPQSYCSYEKMMGVKLPSAFAFGCNRMITIKGVNCKLLLKRSCFLIEYPNRADIFDVIKAGWKRLFYKKKNKFRVMYEDGSLRNGWVKCSENDSEKNNQQQEGNKNEQLD